MSLGGSFISRPHLARHRDGHLEVFAISNDGRLLRKHQHGPNQAFVDEWTPMGQSVVLSRVEPVEFDPLVAAPTSFLDSTGRMTVLARTTCGRVVYACTAADEPAGWTTWRSLASASDRNPAVGNPVGFSFLESLPPDGGVVLRGSGSQVLMKTRGPGRDDWQDGSYWFDLGGVSASDPSVGQGFDLRGQETRLCVLTRGLDHWLYWKGESLLEDGRRTPYPSQWERVVPPTAGLLAGPPVACGPTDAVWRGANGSLWGTSLLAGAGQRAHDLGLAAAGDPSYASSGERSWLVWRSPDGYVMVRRQPNEAPVPIWLGAGVPALGDPVAQVSENGRLEVVFVGADAQLYHLWETTPDSGVFKEGE